MKIVCERNCIRQKVIFVFLIVVQLYIVTSNVMYLSKLIEEQETGE